MVGVLRTRCDFRTMISNRWYGEILVACWDPLFPRDHTRFSVPWHTVRKIPNREYHNVNRLWHHWLRDDCGLPCPCNRRYAQRKARRVLRSGPCVADKLATTTGCKAYHYLAALLADPAVQVVTIGTPSGAHGTGRGRRASGQANNRKKPLEITLRRCDKIIEACDKAGVVLSTIFPSRFHDSAVELKRAVEQNRFGRLTLGDAIVKWYRSQAYYDSGEWRRTGNSTAAGP